jgi:hypothetical protein
LVWKRACPGRTEKRFGVTAQRSKNIDALVKKAVGCREHSQASGARGFQGLARTPMLALLNMPRADANRSPFFGDLRAAMTRDLIALTGNDPPEARAFDHPERERSWLSRPFGHGSRLGLEA